MDHPARTAPAEAIGDAVLRNALELLPDAVALFDPGDRLMAWNAQFTAVYSPGAPLSVGQRYDDIIAAAVAAGLVPEAAAREEAWVAEMLDRHHRRNSTHEQRLADGRWIRVRKGRSTDGWTLGVGTDVSDLKQGEASFRLLFEANPVPMVVADAASLQIVAVNDAAVALYGHPRERFLAKTMLDIRPEREREPFLKVVAEGGFGDYSGQRAWAHLRADGSEIAVVPHAKALVLDGRAVVLVSMADITERQAAEAEAQRVRAFLDSVIDLIPFGVFVKDMKDGGRYVVYNRRGEEIIGRAHGSSVGRRDDDLSAAHLAARYARQDAAVMRSGVRCDDQREIVTQHDGLCRTVEIRTVPIRGRPDGDLRYLLGVMEDVTERRAMAKRLDHMAHHDPLTGLPNRAVLNRHLAEIAEAGAECVPMALLYIDLDGFKAVNDTLGHRIGDGLLCQVAARILEAVPPPSLAVRVGGDEFVVLAPARGDCAIPGGPSGLARRVIASLGRPYDVEGRAVAVTASVGIAEVDDADGGPEAALRRADVALYAAKRAGAGRALSFSPEMEGEARRLREIGADLRRALDAGEFELEYRPVVATEAGRLAGFHALPVWRHPVRGRLEPEVFIPSAEQSGLAMPLGAWMLAQACRDAASWPVPLAVAVNVSPVQFRDERLPGSVASALAASGLSSARLEIAVTEPVLLDDAIRSAAVLDGLRKHGVRIALDDFGTGASSLGHLQRFAFDTIKIDGALVRGLPCDRRSATILRAVAGLAADLGATATAKGVDTEEQLACVRDAGCRSAQGALFGGAEPIDSALARFPEAAAGRRAA